MANMNNMPFEMTTHIVQGDTVRVMFGGIDVGPGIVHLPFSTIMPAIVFITIMDGLKEQGGPRKTFATFNNSDYFTTRMVLTEKNIYKCLHGAQSIEQLWLECEGIYTPDLS